MGLVPLLWLRHYRLILETTYRETAVFVVEVVGETHTFRMQVPVVGAIATVF